ncbi:MAG TPA: hypothetical protein DCY89_05790 [Gammaproteobacteria bacterium]|nr:hypothetical protein [Gammaproteobacteria bacterium]
MLPAPTTKSDPSPALRPISIGMPVYNGQRFLRQAIESILAQSHPNFELIISDNASTDQTAEICAEYAHRDERIRYVRQERNIGAAANFRFVLDASRHDFFVWAACDDFRADSFLLRTSNVLEQDETLACALGSVIFVMDDGETIVYELHTNLLYRAGAECSFFMAREPYFKCMLMYGLFRKEHLLAANWPLLTDTGFWWNDALFLQSIVRQGGLHMFSGAPTMYRVNWRAKVPSVSAGRGGWLLRLTGLHPVSFYLAHLRISQGANRVLIALLAPAKAVKSMLEFYLFAGVKVLAMARVFFRVRQRR